MCSMTPDPTAITLAEIAADEALEFWSKVPNFVAYWSGYRDCAKALYKSNGLTDIPGFRELAAQVHMDLERENAALRYRVDQLEGAIRNRAVGVRSATLRDQIVDLARDRDVFQFTEVATLIPAPRSSVSRMLRRMTAEGKIERIGTNPYIYRIRKNG